MKAIRLQGILCSLLLLRLMSACSSNDADYTPIPQSPVQCDLSQVPYAKLSDYRFFEGELKNLTPSIGVLPYQPSSEFFPIMP